MIWIGVAALATEIGWLGWQIIKRLDWQHDTIIPWIDAVNTKLGLPK